MQDDDLTVRIVERIAELEGTDPVELTPPLHDVVDTDALESLFATRTAGRSDASVTFTYRGHTVRVDGSGSIHVQTSCSDTAYSYTDD